MEVYIVGYGRTATGSFLGSLSSLSATDLGGIAIEGALKNASVAPQLVTEVIMGNVISANLGQAPATQAAVKAHLGYTIPSTTVNKVCASGMKAVSLAAASIQLGLNEIVVAGGMESMSNIPHYLPKSRNGIKFGHGEIVDGLVKDGLFDAYNQFYMGDAAELCVEKYAITRQEQDDHAISSYTKGIIATKNGKFVREIIPVNVKGQSVTEDEELANFDEQRIRSMKTHFKKSELGGTISAGNASKLNDGASAIVLASKSAVDKYGLKPIAQILSFADAQQDPKWFTTSPSLAIPKALSLAKMELSNVDFFEINEAFSAVAIANQRILGIDSGKCNVYGGGVGLGHPLGSSGSRIIGTLISVLSQEGGSIGCAAVCNGGGGASAIVIKLLK